MFRYFPYITDYQFIIQGINASYRNLSRI